MHARLKGNAMSDFRDLRLLIALERNKSFSVAASECNISQPAFSKRVSNMEYRFGLPLVRRGNNFIGFTREGELVLKWARRLLSDAEAMHQEIKAIKNELSGTLVLGVIPTATSFAVAATSELRFKFPKVEIKIYSLSTSQINRGLNDFSLDAGILYFEDSDPKISKKLYDETYMLISKAELLGNMTKEVDWIDVCEIPLTLLTPDMRNRQLIDEIFRNLNLEANIVAQASDFTSVISHVVHGQTATIAPKNLADTFFKLDQFEKLTLKNPHVSNTIALSMKEYTPALPIMDAFKRSIQAIL